MRNFLRRKPIPQETAYWLEQRAALFAMDDLDTLVKRMDENARQHPVGKLFISAQQKAASGNRAAAIEDLRQIVRTPGLEARVYLWAWYNLRQMGVEPGKDQEIIVRGMVIEINHASGRQVLAAYQDHSARCLDSSSGLVIWDEPDEGIDRLIEALLATGAPILQRAQPWNKPEPGPPAPGLTRISVLTDQGLYFGQGPQKFLARDKLAGAPIQAAAELRSAILKKPGKTKV